MDFLQRLEAEDAVRKVAADARARTELDKLNSRGRGWIIAMPLMAGGLSALLSGLPGVSYALATIAGAAFTLALYAAIESHQNTKCLRAIAQLLRKQGDA